MKKALLCIIFASLMVSLVGGHTHGQEIVIDGKKDDWQGISPILTDPKDVENEEVNLDIKAVYAASDEKYLYLMIETYEVPDLRSGYSFTFDVNDDSTAEYSAEFGSQNMYFHNGIEMKAGDAEPIVFNIWKLKMFRFKYKVGRVVEARVPLSYLENPAIVRIGARTNIWTLYNEGYDLTKIYIDSACCSKIDTVFKTKRQSDLATSLVGWHVDAQRIVIDGKKNDWQKIQPIISDLKDVENENAYDFVGEMIEIGERFDIKTVYATSDEESLYLMIETYGVPDSRDGYSFTFGVNDDGIAEYSVAFGSAHQYVHGEGTYKPGESIIVNLRKLKFAKVKYAIDRVFEAKIPLSYLDNPNTISIGCKTNVWCFNCRVYNTTPIYIDSACCGKIDTLFKTKKQSEEKAGIGALITVTGTVISIGYLKKKRHRIH